MDDSKAQTLPASQSRIDTEQQEAVSGFEKKFIVKHNKGEVALTLDELLKNAEKGLDYDRIRPSHEFVKSLAAKDGETDVTRFISKKGGLESGNTNAAEPTAKPDEQNMMKDEMEVIKKEYPEYFKDGGFSLPQDVMELQKNGFGLLDACRYTDLKHTKELCAKLSAKLETQDANRANAQISIGSLSGGQAVERDYYTSEEWDRLPQKAKDKFIRNGKIYEFMKKWSGKK
jgi:hypothetical protein